MGTFLIVDDSIFMRNIIKDILIKHGHTVVGEAENGKVALEKYKELSPDIVTLDVTMDEMTGLEALREILQFDPRAMAVMVSSMGQRGYVQDAVSLGAKAYLVKPFDEQSVVSEMTKLLGIINQGT